MKATIHSVRTSYRLLNPRERFKLALFAVGRLVVNLFDVISIALVGVFAAVSTGPMADRNSLNLGPISLSLPYPLGDVAYFLLAGIFCGFLLKVVLASVIIKAAAVFLAKIETNWSLEIAKFMFSGDLSRLNRFDGGKVLWTVNTSTQRAVSGLLGPAMNVVGEGSLVLLTFVVLLVVDPFFALAATIYFSILVAIFQKGISKRIAFLSDEFGAGSVKVSNSLHDLFSSFRERRVARQDQPFLKQLEDARDAVSKSVASQTLLLSLPRYFAELSLVFGIAVLLLFQLSRGGGDGALASIALFMAGGFKIIAALIPIQNSITSLRLHGVPAREAQQLIEEIRDRKPTAESDLDDQRRHSFSSESGEALRVEVKNLSFAYEHSFPRVLHKISLQVDAGEFVALIGKSGAGKSTLLDLILGLLIPTEGEVLIGGTESQKALDLWGGRVAYLPQSPAVIFGTIAQNVAMNLSEKEIVENRVWECLDKAELSNFVRSLPDGIHTLLGQRSEALSGGQKQRLGLARALYRSPRLLIMDEPTNSLDSETERAVMDTIASLVPSTTVLMIAHQISTIKRAERILVLQAGKLLGAGSYHDLKGVFPELDNFVE